MFDFRTISHYPFRRPKTPIGERHMIDGTLLAEMRRRLLIELQKVAEVASLLRPEWEPLLDSKRVVGTILVIEEVIPGFKIPPDQVVRKGGYNSVNEALEDMCTRIAHIYAKQEGVRT